MSKEAAGAFLKAIHDNPALKEQIGAQGLEGIRLPENEKKLLDIATKMGYSFTAEELTAAATPAGPPPMESGELSDEDLRLVAGGTAKDSGEKPPYINNTA
jgi:predicted ribosomally synthesized peptide with nif11-like leader